MPPTACCPHVGMPVPLETWLPTETAMSPPVHALLPRLQIVNHRFCPPVLGVPQPWPSVKSTPATAAFLPPGAKNWHLFPAPQNES
jgi:hypothetical protein